MMCTNVCGMLAACAAVVTAQAAAQAPEPNCNSNVYEGNEVWSNLDNFIGQGSGTHW